MPSAMDTRPIHNRQGMMNHCLALLPSVFLIVALFTTMVVSMTVSFEPPRAEKEFRSGDQGAASVYEPKTFTTSYLPSQRPFSASNGRRAVIPDIGLVPYEPPATTSAAQETPLPPIRPVKDTTAAEKPATYDMEACTTMTVTVVRPVVKTTVTMTLLNSSRSVSTASVPHTPISAQSSACSDAIGFVPYDPTPSESEQAKLSMLDSSNSSVFTDGGTLTPNRFPRPFPRKSMGKRALPSVLGMALISPSTSPSMSPRTAASTQTVTTTVIKTVISPITPALPTTQCAKTTTTATTSLTLLIPEILHWTPSRTAVLGPTTTSPPIPTATILDHEVRTATGPLAVEPSTYAKRTASSVSTEALAAADALVPGRLPPKARSTSRCTASSATIPTSSSPAALHDTVSDAIAFLTAVWAMVFLPDLAASTLALVVVLSALVQGRVVVGLLLGCAFAGAGWVHGNAYVMEAAGWVRGGGRRMCAWMVGRQDKNGARIVGDVEEMRRIVRERLV
jgi:hypothetical protein